MVALSQMLIKASTVGTLPVVQQTEMMWTGSLHCGAASNSGQRIGWLPDENTRPVLSIATVLAASEVSFVAVFAGVAVVVAVVAAAVVVVAVAVAVAVLVWLWWQW